MSEQATLFELEDYTVDEDLEWQRYQASRWPCALCGGMPLPDPAMAPGSHEPPSYYGLDPCLGRLPDVQFACCGHGNRPPYATGAGGTLRGEDALRHFRLLGVGPPEEAT